MSYERVVEGAQGMARCSYHSSITRQILAMVVIAGLTYPPLTAQIKHEVRVCGQADGSQFLRFNSKLQLVGDTSAKGLGGVIVQETPIAIDGSGRSWIAFDPLNTMQLLRIDKDGVVQPSARLSDNPVNVVVAVDGRAFAITRIGLSAPGPAYGVAADGTVLWSNIEGPAFYNLGYPHQLALTAGGDLWIGDARVLSVGAKAVPYMVLLNKDNGDVITRISLPGNPAVHVGVCGFMPAGDGSLWAFACGGPYRWLFKIQGTTTVNAFPVNGGWNNVSIHMHVDALDRPHILAFDTEQEGSGTRILRYDPAAPGAPDAVYQMGGIIQGWQFGPSGEELFAVVAPLAVPLTRRLERLNVISGTKSSVPLDPAWTSGSMSYGDATGFLYANVIDRLGDNDGDGAPNGAETAAGTSPYDATSRPGGPKVYLSFTQANAIELTYIDPDGLFNPIGGLDFTTLSLATATGNNVFSFLLQFLTAAEVSPDGTQAIATFGALSLPSNLKIRLEASVLDLTGAKGWDWQVTPPGDL
jgi:hypothetical protein